MVDELDLSQEKKWFYEECSQTVVKNLQKRRINAKYVPDRKQALAAILEMIPAGAVVSRGDSMTVDQVGVFPALEKRGQNKLIDPLKRNEEGLFFYKPDDRRKLLREMFSSDIFITGTNAISLDGKLVSTDGVGSRVAAMIYGPDKVIFVVGANKIVKDADEGRDRIRQIAAPINVRRHQIKHARPQYGEIPCARTGRCVDCSHELRICNFTVIIEGGSMISKERLNVVLIGEELGI